MRLHQTLLALSLIAALSACTAAQAESPGAKAVQEPEPVETANPMASFSRMVGGEWRLTAPGMKGQLFDTWHWGPGRHSMRAMTDGSAASGDPWRAMTVFYSHPGRKQVCMLSLHPDIPGIGRGVSEGTIRFEGETADGVFDLYQNHGPRKMGLRWAFDGPDKYHDILLEATGPKGLERMNAWDHVRSKGPAEPRLPIAEEAPKLAEHLKLFEPLLGHTWEAKGEWATGGDFHVQSTFEWVPYSDAIYARTSALNKDGEIMHLLDAYVFHHTGIGRLRCLALSQRGGVYEGDVTVLDGGALQLDLKGNEGGRDVSCVVRFDFEQDGSLRNRAWSLAGAERALVLDVRHQKLEPKVADPMASFARMIPGSWRVTFTSGESSFGTWHWGPGKHSMRTGALEVFYWHPGRKQVCLLSMHSDIPGVGRGVGEGTVRFEGETAEGLLDLYQPRGLRKLGFRWTFDGPDKYRDTLLEASGSEGFKPLNEMVFFRDAERVETQPGTAEEAPKPSEPLKVFESLLGGTWEAKGDSPTGDPFHIQSTFEWVPDYVHARVHAPSDDGEPTHVFEAYFYEHVRTGALRCLALSNRGGVYEGDLTVLDGGAMQLDLEGYEGERVVPLVVRFDFELDGTLRQRVWSLEGTDRKLMLDVHHKKLESKKN